MNCPNCGEQNVSNAQFCSKCGKKFVNEGEKKAKNNALMNIVNLFINPYKAFKDNEKNATTTSNSLIFSGILIGAVTIINLIVTILRTVSEKTYNYWTGTSSHWNWDRMGDIHYFKVIFSTLLGYAALIAAISGIYYLVSLIFKKKTTFFRLLSIVSISIVPYLTAAVLLSPILSLLSVHVGVFIVIVGLALSLVSCAVLINEEIPIKNSMIKAYVHSACIAILLLALYITFMIVIANKINSLSIFG